MAGFTTLPTLQPATGVGGGPVPILRFWENNYGKFGGTSSNFYDLTYSRFSVQMVNIPLAISFKNPQLVLVSTGAGGGAIDDPRTFWVSIGFYTKTGTSYTLVNSASLYAEPLFNSQRDYINISATSNSLIPPGNYWIGVIFNSSTNNTTQNLNGLSFLGNQTITNLTDAPPFFFRGTSTATRSDLPASFMSTNFTLNTEASWLQPFLLITG